MIELRRKANELCIKILQMCIKSGGHIASAFSCVEIMVGLYYSGAIKFDPERPEWDQHDRFILSKGQASPILYTVYCLGGFRVFLLRRNWKICTEGWDVWGTFAERCAGRRDYLWFLGAWF